MHADTVEGCPSSPTWRSTFDKRLQSWFDANVRLFESYPITILGLYFLIHILVRPFLPVPVGYDEGEQFIVTQQWAWGYSSQPPLFNWLQHLSFQLFGVNSFALIVFKQSLLFAIFASAFRMWRSAGLSVAMAGAGAYSLFMISEIGWEMQRTRTHLCLALLFTILFVSVLYRILQTSPSARWVRAGQFGLLGVVCGLGMLSKYNFFILPAGLIIAVGLDRNLRSRVLVPLLGITLLVATLIVAPHWFWMMQNPELLTHGTAERFGIAPENGLTQTAWLSFTEFFGSIALFYTMPALLLLIWYLDWREWGWKRSAEEELPAITRNLFRVTIVGSVIGLLFVFAITLATGITDVKSRWLAPTGFLVVAILVFHGRVLYALNTRRLFWFTMPVLMILGSVVIFHDQSKIGFDRLETIPAVADSSWESIDEPQRTVVAINTQEAAAMLRLKFPELRIMMRGYSKPVLEPGDRLMVFYETREGEMPGEMNEYLKAQVSRNLEVYEHIVAQSDTSHKEHWVLGDVRRVFR